MILSILIGALLFLSATNCAEQAYKVKLSRSEIEPTNELNGSVPLSIFFGAIWVGELSLGTPQQHFKVIFDSGAKYFWVPSSKCADLSCKLHKSYDSSASSSSKPNGTKFELEHRGLNIEAMMSEDRLEVGGIQVRNAHFGEALHVPGVKLAIAKYDGVFGMDLNGSSPVEAMIEQKLLPKKLVSFYLNRAPERSTEAGEVLFGGLNKHHYRGKLSFFPTISANNWHINLTQIRVQNLSLSLQQAAIVWTGAPLMVGPAEPVRKINKLLGAKELSSGAWLLPHCELSKLPEMVVQIGGKDFSLKPEQYVVRAKVLSKEACFSGLAGKDGYEPGWILGDVFISAYYTVFDFGRKRIGFGAAAAGAAVGATTTT